MKLIYFRKELALSVGMTHTVAERMPKKFLIPYLR